MATIRALSVTGVLVVACSAALLGTPTPRSHSNGTLVGCRASTASLPASWCAQATTMSDIPPFDKNTPRIPIEWVRNSNRRYTSFGSVLPFARKDPYPPPWSCAVMSKLR